jgi:hypothetical protein
VVITEEPVRRRASRWRGDPGEEGVGGRRRASRWRGGRGGVLLVILLRGVASRAWRRAAPASGAASTAGAWR